MPFRFNTIASESQPSAIIACLDLSPHDANIATAAARLAEALDLPLTLFHVIEPASDPGLRPDPLEWDLRRLQSRRQLERLSKALPFAGPTVRLELEEGDCVRAICDKAGASGSLLVMGARAGRDVSRSCSLTAQRVLDSGVGSVLLVPAGQVIPDQPFGRVLVPLDGSAFGETVLAEAARLARKTRAEMVLIHVVPDPGLTLIGPPEIDDLELRLRLDLRNEKAACAILERIWRRFADQGLSVRSRCLKGDTRSMLQRAIAEEQPGLVVLSTRGQGGRNCQDLAMGSTAAYLLAHLQSPLLLLRPEARSVERSMQKAPEIRVSASANAA